MKHSDFTKMFRELEHHLEKELAAAVMAHGGVYTFIHLDEASEVIDEREEYSAPRVLGSYKFFDDWCTYTVSRVEVRNGLIEFFGWQSDPGWSTDESRIDDVKFDYYDLILDAIPETDEVKDVTMDFCPAV